MPEKTTADYSAWDAGRHDRPCGYVSALVGRWYADYHWETLRRNPAQLAGSLAGMASFGATSLNWAPAGSAAVARRP
jgi:hypothetical protein